LLLPANTVLIQHLSVPLLATRNLREVLGFELDKHTPFNATELYFDARVISRDKRQAKVVLVAILRERLQAILDHCEQQGLVLQAVDVRDTQGTPLSIDLLPSPDNAPATASTAGCWRSARRCCWAACCSGSTPGKPC
jgi:general secretion pathway protein L